MEINPTNTPIDSKFFGDTKIRDFSSTNNSGKIFNKTPINPKPIFPIILGLLVSLLIIGAVWFVVFRKNGLTILKPYSKDDTKVVQKEPQVMNPITGVMYSEKDAAPWINIRPLAAMINNHVDARPQSGLIDADLVYEMVAEGGITRYVGFFLTNTPTKIGPIRSTREYYLVLVKELGDAMLMHIGYSPQALEAIETWPVRSLFRGGADFWRDQDRLNKGVAIEHTAYVNGVDLRKLGDELGWEGKGPITSWKFKDDGPVDLTQQCLVAECKILTIDFWDKGDYTGMFKYDRASNLYLRYTGYDSSNNPIALIDQESKQQVKIKNVIVQFAKETSIAGDDKGRLTYDLIGSGTGLVFMDGKVVKVTWSKATRDARTMFYDESGNEIAFNRGKFWISIVPDRNEAQVVY